jgi:hypothetical protein
VLVADVSLDVVKKKKRVKRPTSRRIKWWKLKDPFLNLEYKRKVIESVKKAECEDQWRNCKESMLQVGEKVLGKTSGKGKPKDKETWWWSEEVKNSVKKKKEEKRKRDLIN